MTEIDSSLKGLLTEPTTVVHTPGYEGANIGTIIGFKHVNYLVEKAVIDHFRAGGLPVGALYEDHGLGFDLTHLDARLNTALIVDDQASIEVRPVTKDGDDELAFKVAITVDRDGAPVKAVTATARAVLRRDEDDRRMPDRTPPPPGLERFVRTRIGDARPGEPVKEGGSAPLISGGSTDNADANANPDANPDANLVANPDATPDANPDANANDPVLAQLTQGQNAYAWKFRVPYPYVHFFERVPMSGYLRLMEEAKHRFVDARGISIRTLLAESNWIPAVTRSRITLLDETHLEEDLYTVYTVDSVFKNLLYTARVDWYVVRDGHLIKTATGEITHGYGVVENGKRGRLVEWDDRVARALSGEEGGR